MVSNVPMRFVKIFKTASDIRLLLILKLYSFTIALQYRILTLYKTNLIERLTEYCCVTHLSGCGVFSMFRLVFRN